MNIFSKHTCQKCGKKFKNSKHLINSIKLYCYNCWFWDGRIKPSSYETHGVKPPPKSPRPAPPNTPKKNINDKVNKCYHKTIILSNTTGKKINKTDCFEVDFTIRCNDCNKELFRISEYKREIINLSKY